MELLIIELADIARPIFDARKQVLLPRVIEHVGLESCHVDAAEQLEICDVLQGSLADDRQDPPCRSIVDDICQIFGNPHRNPGGAGRLELDHTSVDHSEFRSRPRGLREPRAGDRGSQGEYDRCGNGPTVHWRLFPCLVSRPFS